MKIYGGFMLAMGTTAVAINIALLIGASLGTAGLIALGVGCAVILGGIGLFAITHKKQKANSEVLNNSSLLQNSSLT